MSEDAGLAVRWRYCFSALILSGCLIPFLLSHSVTANVITATWDWQTSDSGNWTDANWVYDPPVGYPQDVIYDVEIENSRVNLDTSISVNSVRLVDSVFLALENDSFSTSSLTAYESLITLYNSANQIDHMNVQRSAIHLWADLNVTNDSYWNRGWFSVNSKAKFDGEFYSRLAYTEISGVLEADHFVSDNNRVDVYGKIQANKMTVYNVEEEGSVSIEGGSIYANLYQQIHADKLLVTNIISGSLVSEEVLVNYGIIRLRNGFIDGNVHVKSSSPNLERDDPATGARLSGDGKIEGNVVVHSGVVVPGEHGQRLPGDLRFGAGQLTIDGDLIFNDGYMLFDIFSNTRHDILFVEGDVFLNGGEIVFTFRDFLPSSEQMIHLLVGRLADFQGVSFSFEGVSNSYTYGVVFNPQMGIFLSVAPLAVAVSEPASMAIFLAVVIGLAPVGWRRFR